MGKYHNVLYIALKVAWNWNIKHSGTICELLCKRDFIRFQCFNILVPHGCFQLKFTNASELLRDYSLEPFLDRKHHISLQAGGATSRIRCENWHSRKKIFEMNFDLTTTNRMRMQELPSSSCTTPAMNGCSLRLMVTMFRNAQKFCAYQKILL